MEWTFITSVIAAFTILMVCTTATWIPPGIRLESVFCQKRFFTVPQRPDCSNKREILEQKILLFQGKSLSFQTRLEIEIRVFDESGCPLKWTDKSGQSLKWTVTPKRTVLGPSTLVHDRAHFDHSLQLPRTVQLRLDPYWWINHDWKWTIVLCQNGGTRSSFHLWDRPVLGPSSFELTSLSSQKVKKSSFRPPEIAVRPILWIKSIVNQINSLWSI